MTKNSIFTSLSIALSGFAVWVYIITQVQPDKSDYLLMVTFFASLIMWLGSLLAFSLYRLRIRRSNNEIVYAYMSPSIRQGFLVAATIAVLLFMQMIQVLSAWDLFLVLMVASLIELAANHKGHRGQN